MNNYEFSLQLVEQLRIGVTAFLPYLTTIVASIVGYLGVRHTTKSARKLSEEQMQHTKDLAKEADDRALQKEIRQKLEEEKREFRSQMDLILCGLNDLDTWLYEFSADENIVLFKRIHSGDFSDQISHPDNTKNLKNFYRKIKSAPSVNMAKDVVLQFPKFTREFQMLDAAVSVFTVHVIVNEEGALVLHKLLVEMITSIRLILGKYSSVQLMSEVEESGIDWNSPSIMKVMNVGAIYQKVVDLDDAFDSARD